MLGVPTGVDDWGAASAVARQYGTSLNLNVEVARGQDQQCHYCSTTTASASGGSTSTVPRRGNCKCNSGRGEAFPTLLVLQHPRITTRCREDRGRGRDTGASICTCISITISRVVNSAGEWQWQWEWAPHTSTGIHRMRAERRRGRGGRRGEQEAAWAERRVFARRQGGLTGAGCQCQCGGYWGHLPGCKVPWTRETAQQGSEDQQGRRSRRSEVWPQLFLWCLVTGGRGDAVGVAAAAGPFSQKQQQQQPRALGWAVAAGAAGGV